MLKLVGLFVGLAAVAATRAEPPRNAAATPFRTSVEVASTPPLYAARDAFSGLGLPRP
jgi:hypothetical protein